MGCYLKNDDGIYLKDIDSVNTEIFFTSDRQEAKDYPGEWYADTELEYVKFHFKDKDEVKTMKYVVEH